MNRKTAQIVIPACLSLLLSGLLAACGGGPQEPGEPAAGKDPAMSDEELARRAGRLAREMLLVDSHVDVPYRLEEEMEDISQRTEKGDFDYPRAVSGGLDAPFMSIYVPARLQETGGSRKLADRLIDMIEKFESDWPEKFAVARSTGEVRAAVAAGKIALPLGMENGSPVESDLENLRHFHRRGIRYITLTHSENNEICDSSYSKERKWNGLSPFGREVVAEMNRLGIMVDISHVTDDTANQVLDITSAPVIASHSSCRRFTPGWERNISDDLIKRVAKNGGVVMINFGSAFLNEAANKQSLEYWELSKKYREDNALDEHDPAIQEFRDRYWKEHEKIFATMDDVVANIDHVVRLAGIDHVGFGSDFDGVGDSLPEGLKDVSGYPNLIHALLKKGYSEADLRKICGENLMRVWAEVERIAAGEEG